MSAPVHIKCGKPMAQRKPPTDGECLCFDPFVREQLIDKVIGREPPPPQDPNAPEPKRDLFPGGRWPQLSPRGPKGAA